jgi:hypothetical protein
MTRKNPLLPLGPTAAVITTAMALAAMQNAAMAQVVVPSEADRRLLL